MRKNTPDTTRAVADKSFLIFLSGEILEYKQRGENASVYRFNKHQKRKTQMNLIQTLKDSHYNIIGYIFDDGDRLVIKDSHYNEKGFYEKRTDITKDSHYNEVGHGNLLTSLL